MGVAVWAASSAMILSVLSFFLCRSDSEHRRLAWWLVVAQAALSGYEIAQAFRLELLPSDQATDDPVEIWLLLPVHSLFLLALVAFAVILVNVVRDALSRRRPAN